jgi:prepilin-type N-terminal cleavage/methylation domain-containing protein
MKRRPRKSSVRAFTLIELMLVIAVMAILAAATGAALAQAMEQGRVSRTQAQIARIHGLLMTKYDSYRTRNIRLSNNIGFSSANPTWQAQDQQFFNAQRRVDRLRAIRMTMRLEMPENLRDLFDYVGSNPVPVYGPSGIVELSDENLPSSGLQIITTIRRPSLSDAYFRRIQAAIASAPNNFTQTGDNAPSECLYLILSSIQDGDTNGLDFLLPSEIADTDQDGIPEVLDAWGRPIFFFRWPAGFESPLQNHKEPDPFDPLRVDPRSLVIDPVTGHHGTYAMTPLVYSAGPDGSYGLVYSADENFTYSSSNWSPINEENDPFSLNPGGLKFGSLFPSADGTEGWHDNIVSHFLSNN